jgi:4-carboxymuconolactone decarboxylase
MTDQKNPFETMMTQWQDMAKVWSPMMAQITPKDLEAFWPTMPKEAMEFFFGKTVNKDGLDARTRLFLTLGGLTMQGAQADTALRQTVRHLTESGATAQEIAEAIGMMSLFAGLPAATRALEIAREVLDDGKEKG